MAEALFGFDILVFHPYGSLQSGDGKSGDRAGLTGDLGAFAGCWGPGGHRQAGSPETQVTRVWAPRPTGPFCFRVSGSDPPLRPLGPSPQARLPSPKSPDGKNSPEVGATCSLRYPKAIPLEWGSLRHFPCKEV